jgi:hypothetical protein
MRCHHTTVALVSLPFLFATGHPILHFFLSANNGKGESTTYVQAKKKVLKRTQKKKKIEREKR